jgi:hypothetical protein
MWKMPGRLPPKLPDLVIHKPVGPGKRRTTTAAELLFRFLFLPESFLPAFLTLRFPVLTARS